MEKPFSASPVQNRPKSRSNPACQVFSLPFLQNRNTGRNFGSQGGVHSKRKRPQDVIPTVFAASYIFFIPFSSTNRTFPGRLFFQPENHPAIIERAIFERVQEEVSQRNSKRKVKEISTKTELGRYSSKYPLTDLLFCGKCGAPHRRTTWSKNSKKKIVWRCISRLDYGTKYCKESPSIEESLLQNAIATTITKKAQTEGANILKTENQCFFATGLLL